VLPEGSQIVEFCVDEELPPPPVPMLGHVTSSYRSAELRRPFALALVKGGRSHIGDTVHVPSTAPSSRSRSPARCWSIPKDPSRWVS
jgi:glycine cleavage system aminomethyltransferase T